MFQADGELDQRFERDWVRIEQVIQDFERACWSGCWPEIEAFLPVGEDRRAILVELVHTDLELRLKAGEPVDARTYLAGYPELAEDPRAASELLAREKQLRELWCRHEDSSRGPALPRPPRARPRIGRFELREIVGRGSFGVVYRAFDTELDRIVAVKILRAGVLGADAEVDRFLREVRNTARLHHPGIVTLHEAGRCDGDCYLVSEFIDGPTLTDRLASGPMLPREAAELAARVADVLDFTHRHEVVHRDIKPSNILLDREGHPHLADFGLARRVAGESTLTVEGQVLGTPAYMSPEQARGEGHGADGRSDIYSLGVVLYQMLTRALPFSGGPRQLMDQILHEEPRPPRRWNDRIGCDLETICLTAMAKLPGDRYTTAADLAADLRHYLRGEPVTARPIGPVGRIWRRARRQPVLFGLSAALVLAVLGGSFGVTWQWVQTRSALESERRQSERALAALRHSNRIVAGLSRSLSQPTKPSHGDKAKEVKQTLEYYEQYRNLLRHDSSPARGPVLAELALAHSSQGLMLKVAGRQAEAERALLEAVALCEDGLRTHPHDESVRCQLASLYSQLARLHEAEGRWADVVHDLERGATHQEQVRRMSTSHGAHWSRIGQTLLQLGQARIEAGDPAGAHRDLRRGLERLEETARVRVGTDLRDEFCSAHVQIGRALDRLDRPAEALESFRRALALIEERLRDDPASRTSRQRLGMCLHVIGNLYMDLERPADAAESFSRALAIRQALVRDDPTNAKYRQNQEGTRHNLAEALELAAARPDRNGTH